MAIKRGEFVSLVWVIDDPIQEPREEVVRFCDLLAKTVRNFEIIVIENTGDQNSRNDLRRLAKDSAVSNLRVFVLARPMYVEAAAWVGVENAIGDFVCVCIRNSFPVSMLPRMLDSAGTGVALVEAFDRIRIRLPLPYRLFRAAFLFGYRVITRGSAVVELPGIRLMTKAFIGQCLRYPRPEIAYRILPMQLASNQKVQISFDGPTQLSRHPSLLASFERGADLITSSSKAPLRWTTLLTLFGALANVAYSFYVVLVALLKSDVAPGWVSLSLQQSGMFLLISIVLLLLSEYIVGGSRLNAESPALWVSEEFTSVRSLHRERLNVFDARSEEMTPSGTINVQ